MFELAIGHVESLAHGIDRCLCDRLNLEFGQLERALVSLHAREGQKVVD